ncbi:hypothetical protein GCM10010521_64190 [Streptomyces rameus]|uniref:Uncharacterized protein n=1 Tax=Streptomyces rameus TaxID=68261 RepID=A0ABN3V550_9ACTN
MKILSEPLGGALGIGAITRCLAMAQAAVMRGHQVAFLAPDGHPTVDEGRSAPRFPAPAPVRPPELVGTGEADGFTEAVRIRGMAQLHYAERAIAAELDPYRMFAPTSWSPRCSPPCPSPRASAQGKGEHSTRYTATTRPDTKASSHPAPGPSREPTTAQGAPCQTTVTPAHPSRREPPSSTSTAH